MNATTAILWLRFAWNAVLAHTVLCILNAPPVPEPCKNPLPKILPPTSNFCVGLVFPIPTLLEVSTVIPGLIVVDDPDCK